MKSFDPAMIPEPLHGWLVDIADRMQIPPDFSAAATVVALGSVIGRGCGLYPRPHDDWLFVPNLWGAIVGRPSAMKTPSISEAHRHLVRLEMETHEEYLEAIEKFKVDAEIRDITRSAIRDEIKRACKKRAHDEMEQARQKLTVLQGEEPIRLKTALLETYPSAGERVEVNFVPGLGHMDFLDPKAWWPDCLAWLTRA